MSKDNVTPAFPTTEEHGFNSGMHGMAALIQERDALKADAERYRWWVNTMTSEFALDTIADAFQHLQQDVVPTKAQFADVIDAAIKGKS